MSFGIIVKDKFGRFGKTRSEQENNMRREWGCKTLTDEQLDKCKFLEKRIGKVFFNQSQIGRVR